MMKNHLARAGALGTVALGILAAAMTAGCAGDNGSSSPAGTPSDQASTQQAQITSLGFAVNGCNVSGLFNITSPSVINWVALNQANQSSAQSQMQMQLYNVDDMGQQTLVQQQAQQASSSMQAMLNSVVDNINSAQAASQSASQHTVANTAAQQTAVHEDDQTSVISAPASIQNDTAVTHADTHDQAQTAFANNHAVQSASAADQASAAQAAQTAQAAQNASDFANQNVAQQAAQNAAHTDSASTAQNAAQNLAQNDAEQATQFANNAAAANAQNATQSSFINQMAPFFPAGLWFGGVSPFFSSSQGSNSAAAANSQQANSGIAAQMAATRALNNTFANAANTNVANTANSAAANAANTSAGHAANATAANTATASNAQSAHATQTASALDQNTSTGSQLHLANTAADTTHSATIALTPAQTVTSHVMNASSSTAAQNSAADTQAANLASSNVAEQRAINNTTQANATATQSSAQVFNNLAFLNSHHLILSINMSAQQAQNLLNVFQGNQSAVTGFSQFPVATPLCGAGPVAVAPGVVPAVAAGGCGLCTTADPTPAAAPYLAPARLEAAKTEE